MSDIEEIHGITEDPEEDIIPYVGPPKLQPLAVLVNQFEQEDILYTRQCKIYRFFEDEWKQRGQGEIKFIKNKQTKITRLVFLQEQTYFIRANHIIKHDLNKSNIYEFGFEWSADDKTCGRDNEEFAVKFKDQASADEFSQKYQQAQENNQVED